MQARDQQREKHGRRDREAELHEVLPGDAAHEAHRQEHRDDGRRGGDHRQADLIGRIERRLEAALAHAHVAHDVLDLDDRIVHQHAGDQRQREQADRLSVKPIHCMKAKVGIADSGMASAEISVARMSRRNSHTTSTARIEPSISALMRRVVGVLGVVDRGEDLRHLHLRVLLADLGEFGLAFLAAP